jgi:hypothetical protein
MPEVNEGWEARYQNIKEHYPSTGSGYTPGHYIDTLYGAGMLTLEECSRSLWKLELIRPFLARMILNMVKGTLKYPSDDLTGDAWAEGALDDRVDSVNWQLLWENHVRNQGYDG